VVRVSFVYTSYIKNKKRRDKRNIYTTYIHTTKIKIKVNKENPRQGGYQIVDVISKTKSINQESRVEKKLKTTTNAPTT
jgi:hypothetical protein